MRIERCVAGQGEPMSETAWKEQQSMECAFIDRSRFEKRWMLQAFCVNAELRSDLGQFEGADFKKLVCQAWFWDLYPLICIKTKWPPFLWLLAYKPVFTINKGYTDVCDTEGSKYDVIHVVHSFNCPPSFKMAAIGHTSNSNKNQHVL